MSSSTSSIELSEHLRTFVEERARQGAYADAAEYLRERAQRDNDVQAAQRVREWVQRGLESGPATPLTQAEITAIRQRIESAGR